MIENDHKMMKMIENDHKRSNDLQRSFRFVLLATNMSSHVPKCAKETSEPYFRCCQQNSFTLPLFC